jgi:hypothetical protein
VPEPIALEVEMAIEKLTTHKSPGTEKIQVDLIKAGGRAIRCEIHKLIILFGIWRICLRSERIPSLYLFIRRVIKHTVVVIEA